MKEKIKKLIHKYGSEDWELMADMIEALFESYATEREQKYKELWEAMKDLIEAIELELKFKDTDSPLRQKISTLEQELNLK